MRLIDGCHSLKLECALRDLGFVDIGWKTVAHAGIFFIQPYGIPDDPEGDAAAQGRGDKRRPRPGDHAWEYPRLLG